MKLQRIMLLSAFMVLATVTLLFAYSKGPLPKHTGGFGEDTCHACHDSYRLDSGRALGGFFEIEGVPKTFIAGQTYPLKAIIGHPGQTRWGFELSVRFADSGRQAGKLVSTDEWTQVKVADQVQYIEHTLAGTHPEATQGRAEFHFNWIAPESGEGVALFSAAGNAADSSNNPAGDFIYTAGAWSGSSEAVLTSFKPPKLEKEAKLGERLVETSKLGNLPVPIHFRKGALQVHIQHRFFESLRNSSAGDALGIDTGASINLGVNYAFSNKLSMGVSRARGLTSSGINQTIAWTGTYEIQTRSDSFWKMSLVAGVEGDHNFRRQFAPSLQLATSFDYRGLRLHVVPTAVFHSWSGQAIEQYGSRVVNPGDNNTFSLGLGGDIALHRRFSIVGEVVPRLAGYGGVDDNGPAVSGGFEIRTWKHVFTVLVSSSREFTPAKYAVNPGQKNVSLGFNIYRLIR